MRKNWLVALAAIALVAVSVFSVAAENGQPDTQPVYRFANTRAGVHFYTIYESEKDTVLQNYDWFEYEGVGFYASIVPQPGMSPVYRFVNTRTGDHFYTIYESEKDTVLQNYDWFKYEGVGFYASIVPQPGMSPVYRFANTRAGGHFYTIYESERCAVLDNYDWFRYEGIGFYGSTATVATPSFFGDWETGLVTGAGNTNWQSSQRVSSDRITILSDGGARQGTRYARIEVRPGDNPLPCCAGTERAEVAHMQKADNTVLYENLSSGTVQYSFSVKFDSTWQPIIDTGSWGIFLQLHGPNSLNTNPAWALSATDKIRLNVRGGDIRTNSNIPYNLSNGSLNIGKWIDFLFTVKYAADNTGFITLSRRDEGACGFTQVLSLTNIPTLQYDSTVNNGAVGDHYMKHGLYRNANSFTSILYLDGFTRTVVPQ